MILYLRTAPEFMFKPRLESLFAGRRSDNEEVTA